MKRIDLIPLLSLLLVALMLSGCPQQPGPEATRSTGALSSAPAPPSETPAQETQKILCSLCGRSCPLNRAVLADTAEEQFRFCCPFCLARHVKEGTIDPESAKIVFHDFVTQEEVEPAEAWIVEDSDVKLPCSRADVVVAGQQAAQQFVEEHGGTAISWNEYLARETAE